MSDALTVEWTEKERNGAFYKTSGNLPRKCYGIDVTITPNHFITLQPMNSMKHISNSLVLQIPVQYVHKVCSLMQNNLLDMVLTNLKDQLPRLLGLDPTLDELVSAKLKGK